MTNQETFPDDANVLNIELGAGCGDFGKRFYAPCYLTELAQPTCPIFFIDHICDAHNLPWAKDRFIKVIACNPFGYGFIDEDSTTKLMDEISRVIITTGEILIISASRNQFGNYGNINIQIAKYRIKNPHLSITITQQANTNAAIKAIFPDYVFYQVNGKTVATPDQFIIIKITK